MSETKFTPGPWKHNPLFPTSVWTCDGNTWLGSASVETVSSLETRTANAQLFAAAPEMYEALVDARDLLTLQKESFLSAKIDAILAKARGEQP